MPPFIWTSEPTELIQSFETRHKNPLAGALFGWAAWAVESLHYLDDIDRAYDTSHKVIGAHRPDVVDVAHARWATGTCITALDLCAAGLGRSFCAHDGPRDGVPYMVRRRARHNGRRCRRSISPRGLEQLRSAVARKSRTAGGVLPPPLAGEGWGFE